METGNNAIMFGSCIFCLKSSEDCGSITKTFLQAIFQHFLSLRVVISGDNQEWCRHACRVISEMDNGGKNIKVCGGCGEIARKFCQFYNELNELELRVDGEVGRLRDVMVGADKMGSRLEGDELDKTCFSGGGGDGLTLGGIRNTLMQSCVAYQEIKKKMAFPKVGVGSPWNEGIDSVDLPVDTDLLSPISLEDFPILHQEAQVYPYHSQQEVQGYPPLMEMETQGYLTQLEVDNQRVTLAEEVYEHDMTLRPLSPLTTAPPLVLEEEDPLNPPQSSQSSYTCSTPTCSLPFTSKFELFQHNMAYHIRKYFSSVQLNQVSDEQFTRHISHLLEGILDTFEVLDEKYKCPICRDQISGREKARNHLVVKHCPLLKEKLVELQKSANDPPQTPQSSSEVMESNISTTDETSNETLKRKRGLSHGELEISDSDPTQSAQNRDGNNSLTAGDTARQTLKRKGGWSKGKSRKSGVNCSQCSLTFPKQQKLFRHDMYHHPEKFFISVKLECLSVYQFQNCIAHLLHATVEQFQKVDSKCQCTFCGILISRKKIGGVKLHLILQHRLILTEKLVELQNSGNISLIMNTSRRNTKARLPSARNNETDRHICNLCKKDLKSVGVLNTHQIRMHPEIFFETCNLLPSSSKNDEQFKTFVRFILEAQLEAPVPKKGCQVKCGICSHVSNERGMGKQHLIVKHRVFLAQKLEEMQKSGNLDTDN